MKNKNIINSQKIDDLIIKKKTSIISINLRFLLKIFSRLTKNDIILN